MLRASTFTRDSSKVLRKKHLQELFSGGGGDRVAGAFVFGEGFYFYESVAEEEVGPAVGREDGLVQGYVEAAEFQNPGEGGWLVQVAGVGWDAFSPGGFGGAFGVEGVQTGFEGGVVEEVVEVRQAQPEAAHQGAAVFVVPLADRGQRGIRRLPLAGGEWIGLETLRRRVAQILLQRPAVLPRPDFMNRALHHRVEVPAVGGEDVESIGVDKARRKRAEVEMLCCTRCDEAMIETFERIVQLDARSPVLPPVSMLALCFAFRLHQSLNAVERCREGS